jgi:autotransporter-associated beta strand protein
VPGSNDWAYIVNGGTATLSTNQSCSRFSLGGGTGSGNLLITNGARLHATYEYVGDSAAGSVAQSGGTNLPSYVYLGNNHSISGSYNLTGSANLAATYEIIGYSGAGTFTQSGGSNSVTNLEIGNNNGSTGSYIQSGGTTNVTYLDIGGVLDIGSGSYQLNNGNLSSLSEYVGNNGAGTFNQTGGSNSVGGGGLYVGPGSYNMSGGSLSASSETLGYGGTGAFTQLGGTLSVGTLSVGYAYNGTYNLGGGLLNLSALDGQLGGAFTFSGGTLQAGDDFSTSLPMTLGTSGGGATFDTAGHLFTLSGSLSGSGSLTKVGGGTLALTGNNTYTGLTAVNQGELLVNGSLGTRVTVNSGGVLSGTGSLSSVTVNAGGQLSPGDAPGALHISGSLTLVSGAVMDYELGSPGGSDEILMPTGLLTLNGQQFSDINFTPLVGFGPGEYTLIEAHSINGNLESGASGTIGGFPASLAVQGNNLVLNVVPEPGTLALLATGTLGLAVCARRRMRRNPYACPKAAA